jgi:hypothetical protein
MARPGRPPLGDRAMSSTERSRRRRDRLRAKPATKYATKPSGTDADAIAPLKARIRELETELRHERELREAAEPKAVKAAPRDNKDEQIAELEARVRALNEIASHFAQQGEKGPPLRFTPAEYRLLEFVAHSDRTTDPDEKKKHERAFKLLHERLPKEFFVVKPPPARPPGRDLPRTREEMMAARLKKQEENRARARRAAATRAAKRAPRPSIEKRK